MATDLIAVFQEGSLFAFPLALLAGVVAGLNPCCLPIYPAAAGCCSALRQKTARANVGIAAGFVLGNSLMTASLGVVTGLMGRAFRGLGPWPTYVIALLPIAFGLHLLGAVRIPLPATPAMREGRHGVMGAFVTGALIGLVITPCATPVLAGILAYVAMVGEPVRGGEKCGPAPVSPALHPRGGEICGRTDTSLRELVHHIPGEPTISGGIVSS